MSLKRFLVGVAAIPALFMGMHCAASRNASTHPEEYRLRLYHLHTGEHIDVVYRIGDRYLPD